MGVRCADTLQQAASSVDSGTWVCSAGLPSLTLTSSSMERASEALHCAMSATLEGMLPGDRGPAAAPPSSACEQCEGTGLVCSGMQWTFW